MHEMMSYAQPSCFSSTLCSEIAELPIALQMDLAIIYSENNSSIISGVNSSITNSIFNGSMSLYIIYTLMTTKGMK